MKLRTKFEDEDFILGEVVVAKLTLTCIPKSGGVHTIVINSIKELLEDWEVVEPLIKDERIRATIRAWRNCNQDDCFYVVDSKRLKDGSGMVIAFNAEPFKELERRHYTISELCGKED